MTRLPQSEILHREIFNNLPNKYIIEAPWASLQSEDCSSFNIEACLAASKDIWTNLGFSSFKIGNPCLGWSLSTTSRSLKYKEKKEFEKTCPWVCSSLGVPFPKLLPLLLMQQLWKTRIVHMHGVHIYRVQMIYGLSSRKMKRRLDKGKTIC